MSHVFIIDGDMALPIIAKCVDACGYWNKPMIFRTQHSGMSKAKAIVKIIETCEVDYIPIDLTRKGKESVDKVLLLTMQKLISDGVSEITLFAQDRDFMIDSCYLFQMNRDKNFKINVIYPYLAGTESPLIIDPRAKREYNLKITKLNVSQFRTIQDQVDYATR